ncbi:hypothetical protein L210DRAFT_2254053 [Boletus edulis BED1]|uniref:Uncharacterized protein n=1 Tax=Boletus edulis BED1 TaxID=1328754 RepID=A0AAD4G682_BOLED|nr:hypothetical protein L210DRAFT_2254053 [Boletus edulis BED1]
MSILIISLSRLISCAGGTCNDLLERQFLFSSLIQPHHWRGITLNSGYFFSFFSFINTSLLDLHGQAVSSFSQRCTHVNFFRQSKTFFLFLLVGVLTRIDPPRQRKSGHDLFLIAPRLFNGYLPAPSSSMHYLRCLLMQAVLL